jgi:DNA-binding NarL/FixJ family response regulator
MCVFFRAMGIVFSFFVNWINGLYSFPTRIPVSFGKHKPNTMINVALVDPLQLHRSAFALLINSFEGFCVVCEAANSEELLRYIMQSGPPDVVLLNLKQAGMSGYAIAAWLHGNHSHVKILVISMYNHEVLIARFLKTGIRAFLKMEVGREELQKALQLVAEDDGFYVGGNDGKLLQVISQWGTRQPVTSCR